MTKQFFTFLFISCYVFSCSTEAPGIFGNVTFVQGRAYLRPGSASEKKEKELTEGLPVHFEDIIRTESKSAVELQLKNYGLIRVGEKTIFRLSELHKGRHIEIRVEKGKAGLFMNKLPKDQEVIVKTPTVIAAIRGTRFLVTSDDGKQSKVALFGGALELQNDSGKVVLDKPGEVKLKKGARLSADLIEPLSPESIAEMKALENMNAIEFPEEPKPFARDLRKKDPPQPTGK